MWRCRCDCGKYHTVAGCNLTTGDVRSCGCLRREISSSKMIDITGQNFGRLEVLGREPNNEFGHTMWLCKCRCGNQFVASRGNLVQGRITSCGCRNTERIAAIGRASAADLVGQCFGRLVVLKRVRNTTKRKHARWLCRCSCGKYAEVTTGGLHRGTQSCGCLVREVNTKLGKLRVGPLSWSWRSDISDEERLVQRSTDANRKWRSAVYARDNFTCQLCNERGGKLHAHHLDAYNKFKHRRFELDNGVTLCETCHGAFHEFYGRGSNTRAQFVEFKRLYTG